MTTPALFGTFKGINISEVTLRSDAGAEAKIMTWGAVVRDLRVPAAPGLQRVVLGYETFDHYVEHSPYFGATVGRVANRIAGGRFAIDSVTYTTALNEKAATLHGGPEGLGRRPWSIVAHDRRSVTLAILSQDGEMGFPGCVTALCTYRLCEPATLQVELVATTDQVTPVNLAHHSYFNLDGSPDILDHTLQIEADFYTPLGQDLIPTGEIRRVEGTPFDFRATRPIRWAAADENFFYDINFVLGDKAALRRAATAASPRNDLALEVWTTEPGLQFYDASYLASPVPGLGGAAYGKNSGFCLEAQNFPDAVNRPHFPSALLRPGEVYRQLTEYRFIAP